VAKIDRSAIGYAVKVKALRQLAREIGVAEAVSELATMDDRTPRERDAAAHQSRKSEILAEYDRLTRLGHGCHATMMVARKFAVKGDPIDLENIARKIRRWRG
jgi:hypothetical protein